MSLLKTYEWSGLSDSQRDALLERPATSLAPGLLDDVRRILDRVRQYGDKAVREFTHRFDGVDVAQARIDLSDTRKAWEALPAGQREALTHARDNIRRFHAQQEPNQSVVEVQPGVACRQIVRPVESVGLYVPGGTAPLPSAVLMLAVPAALAACPRRVLVSPPTSDGRPAPAVLAAAWLCEVTDLYAMGGAQAIGAMAYGTESLAPVDKLFGPGNAYVTAAKMLCAQDPQGAACDMPAGPSEVLVIADDAAHPGSVAADLLAQAEHGADSQVLLFTDSAALAEAVSRDVGRQIIERSRGEILRSALSHSATVVFDDIDDAMAASNRYAPEHLIVNTRDAEQRVEQVQSAGSIFVGPWAAETFGDYCSGTNHVLPTYGFARAYSGVSLSSFRKSITVQSLSGDGFDALADTAVTLANMEGLDAHAAAVSVRRALRGEKGAA